MSSEDEKKMFEIGEKVLDLASKISQMVEAENTSVTVATVSYFVLWTKMKRKYPDMAREIEEMYKVGGRFRQQDELS